MMMRPLTLIKSFSTPVVQPLSRVIYCHHNIRFSIQYSGPCKTQDALSDVQTYPNVEARLEQKNFLAGVEHLVMLIPTALVHADEGSIKLMLSE
jgi:hypothetical protein